MVNDTQIVFQFFPVGPLKVIPGKIYLDKFGMYVNRQTSGIHKNEDGGKLGYMSISAQPSVCATESGNTAFLVPTNPGATVAYPSVNLMAAVISATTRSHEEKIQIWKEYTNVMRSAKKVIFDYMPDTC